METWSLSGNIACGKSAAEGILRAAGVAVIDADQVAREVVAPGTDGHHAVVAAFGPSILRRDGQIDRPALGQIVFAEPERRRELEAILHPRIQAWIWDHLAALRGAGAPLAIVSAALAVETGSYRNHDGLLVVVCPPELQRLRLMRRDGLDAEAARARIAAQLPQDEKARRADVVFHNDGSLDRLADQIHRWLDGRAASGVAASGDTAKT
jgi:dephospho-CoA kinase